jgi:hypothetical protein
MVLTLAGKRMPVILATPEAEIRRIMVPGQENSLPVCPGKTVSKTPFQKKKLDHSGMYM